MVAESAVVGVTSEVTFGVKAVVTTVSVRVVLIGPGKVGKAEGWLVSVPSVAALVAVKRSREPADEDVLCAVAVGLANESILPGRDTEPVEPSDVEVVVIAKEVPDSSAVLEPFCKPPVANAGKVASGLVVAEAERTDVELRRGNLDAEASDLNSVLTPVCDSAVVLMGDVSSRCVVLELEETAVEVRGDTSTELTSDLISVVVPICDPPVASVGRVASEFVDAEAVKTGLEANEEATVDKGSDLGTPLTPFVKDPPVSVGVVTGMTTNDAVMAFKSGVLPAGVNIEFGMDKVLSVRVEKTGLGAEPGGSVASPS